MVSGENLLKTIIKSLLYRIFSFIVTSVVILIITGDVVEATIITLFVEATKTTTYFLFELGWKFYSEESEDTNPNEELRYMGGEYKRTSRR